MADAYAHINGIPVWRGVIHQPGEGVWWAELELTDELDGLSGAVTLTAGTSTWQGVIDPDRSGDAELRGVVRVIGGGAGWRKLLPPKGYHTDAGVLAQTVAADAAAECGETLAAFAAGADGAALGKDFLRHAAPASTAIEAAARSSAWWVGRDGLTRVGSRPAVVAPTAAYTVLESNPQTKVALLAVDDLAAIDVGSVVVTPEGERLTIRALDVELNGDSVRVRAWCGSGVRSRLADAIEGIVARLAGGKLWGVYDYRVVQVVGQRVNVQAVNPADGCPDALALSLMPGVGGFHTKPQLGSLVMVAFAAGDPTRPRVTHFEGQDGARHTPTEVVFGSGTAPVARVGDTVDVFFPALIPFEGLLDGVPIVGTLTITTAGVGQINSGRPELKA